MPTRFFARTDVAGFAGRYGAVEAPLLSGVEMCECIAQSCSPGSYLAHLGKPFWKNAASASSTPPSLEADQIIRPNHLLTAVMNGDGGFECRQVRWGWSPVWSMGTRPPLTHLPLEIVMRSKMFERMRDGGRALVAADGWFNLVLDDPGRGQSTYMRPRSSGPIFLAALAQISEPPNGCNGLVLVTLGGGGASGPLQLLALSSESAEQWLDPKLSWQQAQELAFHNTLREQEFEHVAISNRYLKRSR